MPAVWKYPDRDIVDSCEMLLVRRCRVVGLNAQIASAEETKPREARFHNTGDSRQRRFYRYVRFRGLY